MSQEDLHQKILYGAVGLASLLGASYFAYQAGKNAAEVNMITVQAQDGQEQSVDAIHEEVAPIHRQQQYQSFPNAIPYQSRGGGRGGGRGNSRGSSRGNPRRPLADVECFYCKRRGHYASNCYKKRNDLKDNRTGMKQNQASAIDVYDYESFFQNPKNDDRV